VRVARSIAGKYPLMAAMKQIEAWRTGDDSWLTMAPPLVPLSNAQQNALREDFKALST